MMSLEVIQALSRRHAAVAAREHKQPFLLHEDDLGHIPPFPFPFLGDYVPKGYRITNTYFVDSSGFGTEGEPALTVTQFLGKLKVGCGYGITEAGEFQVHVNEYEKEETNAK